LEVATLAFGTLALLTYAVFPSPPGPAHPYPTQAAVMCKMSTQDMDAFSDASTVDPADLYSNLKVNTSAPSRPALSRKESDAIITGDTFEHHQEDPANFSLILQDLRISLPKDSHATDEVRMCEDPSDEALLTSNASNTTRRSSRASSARETTRSKTP
jgi:hypothetical protein